MQLSERCICGKASCTNPEEQTGILETYAAIKAMFFFSQEEQGENIPLAKLPQSVSSLKV